MSAVSVVVRKVYENETKAGKKFYALVVDGQRYTQWSAKDMNRAAEGDHVSFVAVSKGEYNGQPQFDFKGAIAVSAPGAAAAPTAAAPTKAPTYVRPNERNGMQVGACINNAIDAGLTDPEAIEEFAEKLLLMGDRLSSYKVWYKEELKTQTKADGKGIKESA